MKLLYVIHKSIEYEFRLLEHARVIQVTKDCDNPFEEMTYEMRWVSGHFRCNCPGSVFHGKCWHSGVVNALCQQLSINEPWARWAEDTEGERSLRC